MQKSNRGSRFEFRKSVINNLPHQIIGFLLLLLLGAACNLPSAAQPEFSSTKVVLDAQGTDIGQQMTQVALSTQVAYNVQATIVAQQVAQLTMVANAPTISAPTQNEPTPITPATEMPTIPPPATATPPPPPTDVPTPTEIPATPTPDMESMMDSAKILLFEDVAGVFLERYIKDALDGMGLDYVDVKDAVGDFKAQLLSGTDWDLIISGVEARSGVKGEFFDYLNDQLNKETAVILEIWNLDDIASGRISTIFARCGIKFESDWWDPPRESRSVWWLVPEHPVFHEPNEGVSLAHYSIQWNGDAGDFIKKIPGSDATLLAGNLAWEKDSHGTLATCLDGLFIIQTHSSHDYHKEDMMRLWQNYIYYTLKNHFLATQ